MEVLTYNPQKGRLETIIADFNDETTTWFDGTGNPKSVKMITDLDGNLLITLDGWSYPVIIYDVSREKIKYSRKKAGKLYKQVMF
jgi:hypothetical protein